jgi:hypothetical protein
MKSNQMYLIALIFTIICGLLIFFFFRDDTRPMTSQEIYTYVSINEAKSWESLSYQSFEILFAQGVINDDVAYVRYAYTYLTASNETYEHIGIMKISLDSGILFSYREVDRPISTLNSYFAEFDSAMENASFDFNLDKDDILDFMNKIKPNHRIDK